MVDPPAGFDYVSEATKGRQKPTLFDALSDRCSQTKMSTAKKKNPNL